ncbi:hypothetical protein PRIPAC_72734 [Pristionchus pacificus]|uniref:40S_S4_C domain-containing protein n=1 Tax=Pristionchus pacificus TaxID=54126 RepID=A0A2A6CF16_PRIPA|nr:hypothetical protein PRIPAC_72734 [Pristionchus pacificus]|eukprot:PDM76690.1 hypothetical protein PRIPAC_42085 [Pristionchus pacificus]
MDRFEVPSSNVHLFQVRAGGRHLGGRRRNEKKRRRERRERKSVNNVFVIGKRAKPLVSLTAQLSITEERDKRIAAKKAQ